MVSSYDARNNASFLRNDFKGVGMYGIPKLEKQEINLDNLKQMQLIGFNNVKYNDILAKNTGVHMFVDDYKMQSMAIKPENTFARLEQYQFLLCPDYSMYYEMPLYRQIISTAQSRWVGACWQSYGATVFPTISWSDSRSYSLTMDTVEKGSVVAISTIGVKRSKIGFMAGYHEMMRRIKPALVICYGKPLPEMYGDVLYMPFVFDKVGA